jgi:hypothetical protein
MSGLEWPSDAPVSGPLVARREGSRAAETGGVPPLFQPAVRRNGWGHPASQAPPPRSLPVQARALLGAAGTRGMTAALQAL